MTVVYHFISHVSIALEKLSQALRLREIPDRGVGRMDSLISGV